jgi:hypothetical protein
LQVPLTAVQAMGKASRARFDAADIAVDRALAAA